MRLFRKIVVFAIIGIFISAGIIPQLSGNNKYYAKKIEYTYNENNIINEEINFSIPELIQTGSFIEIKLDGTELFTTIPGAPMIPFLNKIFTVPLGSEVIDVKCTLSTYQTIQISNKIIPVMEPEKIGTNLIPLISLDNDIYQSTKLYPMKNFSYHLGGGLDKDQHVTFIKFNLYPIKYSPGLNQFFYAKNATIQIKFKNPSKVIINNDNE
ncbi:MAG: hypothetical protein DRN27_09825, partial [Thermoplasmata archaeon]